MNISNPQKIANSKLLWLITHTGNIFILSQSFKKYQNYLSLNLSVVIALKSPYQLTTCAELYPLYI